MTPFGSHNAASARTAAAAAAAGFVPQEHTERAEGMRDHPLTADKSNLAASNNARAAHNPADPPYPPSFFPFPPYNAHHRASRRPRAERGQRGLILLFPQRKALLCSTISSATTRCVSRGVVVVVVVVPARNRPPLLRFCLLAAAQLEDDAAVISAGRGIRCDATRSPPFPACHLACEAAAFVCSPRSIPSLLVW